MSDFANPYTFVPFPQVDDTWFRQTPAGHHRLGTAADGSPRLMGTIEVELTARSPLLMSDGTAAQDQPHRFPQRRFPGFDGPVPYLPGSSLAGVVRSLHESIAGGCLRIFDDEYLPSYRDTVEQARSQDPAWKLALVREADPATGRPRKLAVCTKVIRIQDKALSAVRGGPENIATGDRINVVSKNLPRARPGGLPTITDPNHLRPGKGWVVLVTDAQTRQGRKHYYYTAGELPKEEKDLAWADGWLPAWERFQRLIADTDDMRQARQDVRETQPASDKGPVAREVIFQRRVGKGEDARTIDEFVGRRHEARRELFEDQVIWVKLARDNRTVEEFALSSVWRHTGSGKAGIRVPPPLLPCEDPQRLCPTCRVFGSVEDREDGRDNAEQQSYQGHVRFSDARPVGAVPVLERRELPMLSRPRPGAGQFYLDYDARKHDVTPVESEVPLREWGSRLDEVELRQLRGRKHYWLTKRHRERPYFRVSAGSFTGKNHRVAQSVPAGTRFAFTVRFTNLTLAELGALLVALNPAAVLAGYHNTGAEIGFAVGGGRPLGFGSCTSRITGLTAHTAAAWYGNQQSPNVTATDAVAAFTKSVHGGIRDTWPALANALHLDHVPPAKVWYPPANPIPARGKVLPEDLEPGFNGFWRESQGYATKHRSSKMKPLPHVLDTNQQLSLPRPAPTRKQQRRPS